MVQSHVSYRWTTSQCQSRHAAAAVVVANARIRRFARKLIELEFPSMFVLSEEELLPERTNTRLRHGAVPCKGLTR